MCGKVFLCWGVLVQLLRRRGCEGRVQLEQVLSEVRRRGCWLPIWDLRALAGEG